MDMLKNNNGYSISKFDDDDDKRYAQMEDILKCFLSNNYKLAFATTEELFRFIKENSQIFFQDAGRFIEERILYNKDRILYNIEKNIINVNAVKKLKTLWFGINNEEDLKKGAGIEFLFKLAVIKQSDKYKEFCFFITLREMIDDYMIFITVQNDEEFINNIFPKLKQIGVVYKG